MMDYTSNRSARVVYRLTRDLNDARRAQVAIGRYDRLARLAWDRGDKPAARYFADVVDRLVHTLREWRPTGMPEVSAYIQHVWGGPPS